MQLKPGFRLGPYEIVAPAGAGGMGEVYRARDTRLDRNVAIKVLPAEFARDAQLKTRFEREARTISQLSHPHICTLYDVGRHDDSQYLVMEYLDGETLADRLAKGPLPIAQVLVYGSQIAEALDAAHRHRITHRDLKPSNVMLTKTGAKVLDFGLARSTAQEVQADGSLPATVQKPLTQEGMVVGTIQYMAPEQLEGREADPRTDIFALGAVLYEMTTGQRAFNATSRGGVIAAILQHEPPPIGTSQPLTPPALDHVIRKCLEKNPDHRWQSAYDVAEELKWIHGSASREQSAIRPLARRRVVALGTLVAMAVIAGAALAVRGLWPRSMLAPRIESAVLAPEGTRFSLTNGPMALSPDGSRLAFVGRDDQRRALIWIRRLASSTAAPVRGTDGASSPFWSPDGRYLGFFADNKLKKVPVEGGVPEVLSDVMGNYGGTWNSDGVILFSGAYGSGLLKISASGGPAEPVLTGATFHHYKRPFFLPDGRRFLFTYFRGENEPEGIYSGSLDSKETRMVVPGVYFNAIYTPGFLIYVRSGSLWAHRFDLRRLKTTGEPVRIVDRVVYDGSRAAAFFSASANGVVVYCAGGSGGLTRLVWVDRHGKELGIVGRPGAYYHPRLSPDQKRLAIDWSDPINGKGDIWIFDLSRNVPSKFSYDPANETAPVWSPDGRRIIYMVESLSTMSRVFERASSGAGRERPLPNLTGMFPTDWSRDGKLVAMSLWHRGSPDIDIGIATADGKVQKWLETPFVEGAATFSPDGRWIAYMSEESGQTEVYVQSFPAPGTKVLVSQGGSYPAWRGDGRELYYVSEDSKMMAVPLRIGEQFEAGAPIVLFDARVLGLRAALRQYDVTPDGQRFILNRTLEDEASLPMTLLQNWSGQR